MQQSNINSSSLKIGQSIKSKKLGADVAKIRKPLPARISFRLARRNFIYQASLIPGEMNIINTSLLAFNKPNYSLFHLFVSPIIQHRINT